MPLHTSIRRDGEPLQLHWGEFHIAAMVCAAAFDSNKGPFVGQQEPDFQYSDTDDEYAGKNAESYPEVPCPISPKNSFELAMYHIIATTPLNDGSYTLKKEHKFVDCVDGEILHLLPGDELCVSRH